MLERYNTFWQRFGAGFIDGFGVFLPLGLIAFFLRAHLTGSRAFAWDVGVAAIAIAYSVLMTARFGQTLGKMAAGVVVLDVTETRFPTIAEAALRDIGDIAPRVLLVACGAFALLTGDDAALQTGLKRFEDIVRRAAGFWFLVEVVTMLMNDKRRALHDLIAGTVVIRRSGNASNLA